MATTNLAVKQVDFMGNQLMAAQDNTGTIWAGVRWLCEGIGLTEGQIKSERLRIQNDIVLSSSGRNFVLNVSGYGGREVFCLDLDYVPLWLAKINITPAMLRNNPKAAERLLQYQLKAKDVLAAAFLPSKQAHTMHNCGIAALKEQIKLELLEELRADIPDTIQFTINLHSGKVKAKAHTTHAHSPQQVALQKDILSLCDFTLHSSLWCWTGTFDLNKRLPVKYSPEQIGRAIRQLQAVNQDILVKRSKDGFFYWLPLVK